MATQRTVVGFNGTIKHEDFPSDLLARMSWQDRRDVQLRDEELLHIAKSLGADRTQRSLHANPADMASYSLQAFRGSELVMDLQYA